MEERIDLNQMTKKYMDQLRKLAIETGQMIDSAISAMEDTSKDMYSSVSKEAKVHSGNMQDIAKDIVSEMKKDAPQIKQEFKSLQERIIAQLKELEKEMRKKP